MSTGEKKIEQGKFYKIQFRNGKTDVIEISPAIKITIGKEYRLYNKDIVKVLSEVKFKYTFKDIDTIRVMMEDYDEGTIQDNLRKRMVKAFQQQTPAVRFSFEEKEILGYIYYESSFLTNDERETLKKILDIK